MNSFILISDSSPPIKKHFAKQIYFDFQVHRQILKTFYKQIEIYFDFQVHRQHDERVHDGFRNCLIIGNSAGHHQPPRGKERS